MAHVMLMTGGSISGNADFAERPAEGLPCNQARILGPSQRFVLTDFSSFVSHVKQPLSFLPSNRFVRSLFCKKKQRAAE